MDTGSDCLAIIIKLLNIESTNLAEIGFLNKKAKKLSQAHREIWSLFVILFYCRFSLTSSPSNKRSPNFFSWRISKFSQELIVQVFIYCIIKSSIHFFTKKKNTQTHSLDTKCNNRVTKFHKSFLRVLRMFRTIQPCNSTYKF